MADIATSRSPNIPKGKISATDSSSPRKLQRKVPRHEDKLTSNPVDDVESEPGIDEEDIQTKTAEGVADEEEAVPLDSVDGESHVVDKGGNELGTVDREAPEKSVVDTEGDVLDAPEIRLDLSILEGKTVNKLGKIVDEKVCTLLSCYGVRLTLVRRRVFQLVKLSTETQRSFRESKLAKTAKSGITQARSSDMLSLCKI
jgi:hypothetical protein